MHSEQSPFVSVMMPVFNEGNYIERSLTSVIQQDYPKHLMEVIIADGQSTDNTRALIERIKQQDHGVAIHLINNPQRIVPTGLNLAIQQARGDIIVRVDGHCLLAQDYVSRCVCSLSDEQVDAVGGHLNTIGETTLAEAIALAVSSRFGVGAVSFRISQGSQPIYEETDTVVFAAYKRQTLEDGGPFDEEMARNEDDEYNFRLRKLGKILLFCSDIRADYFSQATMRGLWRQYFLYGMWKVRVLQKHPLQMSFRHFVPPAFVVTILLSLLALPMTPLALGVILLYCLANLLASFYLSSKYGWRYLKYLPFVFAILHFSYGTGFGKGTIVFYNKWAEIARRT